LYFAEKLKEKKEDEVLSKEFLISNCILLYFAEKLKEKKEDEVLSKEDEILKNQAHYSVNRPFHKSKSNKILKNFICFSISSTTRKYFFLFIVCDLLRLLISISFASLFAG
jgi:wyosine [tRNA(Phe)-imidazoG37] synthetase (radical SAM superfamily)